MANPSPRKMKVRKAVDHLDKEIAGMVKRVDASIKTSKALHGAKMREAADNVEARQSARQSKARRRNKELTKDRYSDELLKNEGSNLIKK